MIDCFSKWNLTCVAFDFPSNKEILVFQITIRRLSEDKYFKFQSYDGDLLNKILHYDV